jgi:hypothetical protein
MTGTFLYLSLIGPSVSLSDALKINCVIANIYEKVLSQYTEAITFETKYQTYENPLYQAFG